jgi:peptidoglycan-associated lipoprotein
MSRMHASIAALLAAVAMTAACADTTKPPVTKPPSGPPSSGAGASGAGSTQPAGSGDIIPPRPPDAPVVASADPSIGADPLAGQPPDVINRMSPLKPVFFAYDSDQLDDAGRQALTEDAQLLKKYASWKISIEGHSDERGTAEYNLALGERRALSARGFLLSLGVAADRCTTVSYGKEFPFDPGHDEAAWSMNRRAHLVVTANK